MDRPSCPVAGRGREAHLVPAATQGQASNGAERVLGLLRAELRTVISLADVGNATVVRGT